MINLVNSVAKSANVTVTAAFAPLRCIPEKNYSSRTFVEVHVPSASEGKIEWAFSTDVSFGEEISQGDTHTFRVGPNVNVYVRATSSQVDVLVHEGA